MTSIVFNSVPMEDIEANWGSNPGLDRVKSVIREIKRYLVIFESWAWGKLLFFSFKVRSCWCFRTWRFARVEKYSQSHQMPCSAFKIGSLWQGQLVEQFLVMFYPSKKKIKFFLCDPHYLFSNWIFFYSYICH